MSSPSNPFVVAARFARVKAADGPADVDDVSRAALWHDLPRAAVAGVGIGAAARGAVGLWHLAMRRISPSRPKYQYPGAVRVDVPYPVEEEEGAEKRAWLESLTGPGRTSDPLYLPLVTGGAALGTYGGWKGVDAVLNRRRKAEEDDELASARSEFEKALVGSYAGPRPAKTAAEKTAGDELGEALDALYDGLVKAADYGALGRLLGLYGTFALATGGAGAAFGYAAAGRGSDARALERAEKQRAYRAYASRPSEMMAVPRPVPVTMNEAGADGDAAGEPEPDPTTPDPTQAPRRPRRLVGLL